MAVLLNRITRCKSLERSPSVVIPIAFQAAPSELPFQVYIRNTFPRKELKRLAKVSSYKSVRRKHVLSVSLKQTWPFQVAIHLI